MVRYGANGWLAENAEKVEGLTGDKRKEVIILGCGGHTRSICDTLPDLSEQYEITGFVGRIEDKGVAYEGIQVIGTDDDLQQIYISGIHQAVLGIGFLGHGNLRNDLMIKLDKIGLIQQQ